MAWVPIVILISQVISFAVLNAWCEVSMDDYSPGASFGWAVSSLEFQGAYLLHCLPLRLVLGDIVPHMAVLSKPIPHKTLQALGKKACMLAGTATDLQHLIHGR